MKKILVSLFLLVFGLCLVGCDNNKNKKPTVSMLYSDWYNCAKLPSMENPFAEVYDGCYTIKIDENNNVSFKSINQEQLKGTLEYEEKKYTIDIKIKFENNEIANGSVSISNAVPYLNFFYKGVNHCFSKTKVVSKEEFEQYRNDFNKFLREAFIENNYPTIEEVEQDTLYREYTNFVHIDPCCNGPKHYTSVGKVVIKSIPEKDEFTATYSDGTIENINIYDVENIVLVKLDGTFEKLENIQNGQCFLTDSLSIFYFECEHLWDEGVVDPSSSLSTPPIIYTCMLCGTTKKEPSELLEHEHNYIDGKCSCGAEEEKKYYMLSFDTDGGSIIETVLLYSGDTIIAPADPIKEGYEFLGWSPNLPEVMPDDNVEVKALWKVKTYEIIFNTNGGTSIKNCNVAYGEQINIPTDPSKEGYKFLGWYYNDQPWDFKTNVTSDLELYAKWEELTKHAVVFKDDNDIIWEIYFYCGEKIIFDLKNVIDLNYLVITEIGEFPKYMPDSEVIVPVKCYDIRDVFTLSDDGQGISSYLGNSKDVIVPSGYYCDNDFIEISRIESWCFDGNKEIESVELPNTINTIGREAFNNCWNLKTVNIPFGVEVINYKSFSDTSIEKITIPDSVTTIVNSAFSGCEELKSIVIPNSVKEIGDSIFINCTSLVSVSIPFTGNRLENPTNTYFGYIFGDLKYNKGYSSSIPMSLDQIILTNTVDIADSAFEGVKYVNEIILSEGLKTIGEYAFADCDNLRSIEMPSTLEEIKKHAFSSCNELSEIILNEGLKKIQNVIYSGSKLMSIVIPESVEYIGSCAFGNENMTIYCKAEEKPSEWENDWNLIYGADYIDVVWGYEE